MKSVMWSIDSEDWADPVPESVAMRVLHQLAQKQKGIILFHDIHKQGVLALSPVVEELLRQNYTFLSPDKGKFVKEALPAEPARAGDTTEAATDAPTSPSTRPPPAPGPVITARAGRHHRHQRLRALAQTALCRQRRQRH